jgi:TRAP-type uncharacterized transport system substrate-binding protein
MQTLITTLADLENKKVFPDGSGSQLMAYVNADNQGWKNGEASIEILYGPLCR